MKKLIKKAVAKKAEKPAKEKRITAASIVLGMFNLKVVPTDEQIIKAVHEAIEETKFDKTHLAWYKHQYRQGRWNDGVAQVLRQEAKPKTEKAIKAAKKTVKKLVKKAKPAVETEETEEVEA